MKKLLVTLALLTAGATFAAKDTDPFFGPIIPNNTLKAAIKQAVKEANAYTDKAVAGGTSGAVTTNDLNEVKADVAAAADKATAAKTSADAATTAVANLTTTVNDKLDVSVAADTYQLKGNYVTEEADPTVPAWAKGENKPTYNANEIQYGNGFVGDYLAELNGKIPTVPAWAQNDNKPSYDATEITYENGFLAAFLAELNGKIPVVKAWALADNKPEYSAAEIKYGNGFVGDYLAELNGKIPSVPAWALAATKPEYNATEIKYGNGFVGDFLSELNSNKADKSAVPTKVSELTNDSGFLTEHQSLAGYATETWVSERGYLTEHQDISGKLDASVAAETYQPKGNYLTEHQDISGKLDRSEIFPNGVFETVNTKANGTIARLWNEADGGGAQLIDGTTNIKAFTGVNEGGQGGPYAQIYAINNATKVGTRINVTPTKIYYTAGNANSQVTDDDEIVAKRDLKDFITEHQDLSGLVASINKLNKRLSLLEATVALLGDIGEAVEVDGPINYNDPTKSIALAGEVSAPSGASITAKKVSMSGVTGTITPATGANAALLVDSESLNIANSALAGTTQKSSNLIEVHSAETAVIKDTTFTGDTYNTLMTGQRTTGFLKELTIENCVFDENCKHINIWFAGFQDNAVLNIKDCTFKTCEQFLCISDFQGAGANHLTVNIENVTIENYETGDAYEGIILCDDRICTSETQFREMKPFSNVTFNFKNVTAGGTKLSATTFGIGTGTAGQMMYLYSAKGGGVYQMNAGNADLFPTFNFVD